MAHPFGVGNVRTTAAELYVPEASIEQECRTRAYLRVAPLLHKAADLGDKLLVAHFLRERQRLGEVTRRGLAVTLRQRDPGDREHRPGQRAVDVPEPGGPQLAAELQRLLVQGRGPDSGRRAARRSPPDCCTPP